MPNTSKTGILNKSVWGIIWLITLSILLMTGCKKEKQFTDISRDPETGHSIVKSYILIGGKKVLHGKSCVTNNESDTLELKVYNKGTLEKEKQFHLSLGLIKGINHVTGVRYQEKIAEGRTMYIKEFIGDSVLSWHFLDEEGNKHSYTEWFKKNSEEDYQVYVKYFHKFIRLPKNFQFRVLMVPFKGNPAIMDLSINNKLQIYLFDYDGIKFENKRLKNGEVWKKYNTHIRTVIKPAPEKLLKSLEEFIKNEGHYPEVDVEPDVKEADTYFLRLGNINKAKFVSLPDFKKWDLLKELDSLAAYREELDSINKKLDGWKNTREKYFLEEVLKLNWF